MANPRILSFCCALLSLLFSTSNALAQIDPPSLRFEKVAAWPGFSRGDANEIQIVGDLAYLAMADGGLTIVDLSNPAAPVIKGRLDLPGSAVGILVIADTAYVSCGQAGLQIVDISNPAAPVLLSSFKTVGEVRNASLATPFLFLADGANGVVTLDVSNPSRPLEISRISVRGFTYDVEAEAVTRVETSGATTTNRYLQVAAGTNGFLAYTVTNPSSPGLRGQDVVPSSDTRCITRLGRVVYYCDTGAGGAFLGSIDYLGPFNPTMVALTDTFNRNNPVTKFVVTETNTFTRVYFFNESASYSGTFPPSSINPAFRRAQSERSMARAGDGREYFLDVQNGLTAYDGTNFVSSTLVGGQANRVRLADNRVYVANGQQGFHILEEKADGSLAELATHRAGFQRGFAVAGSNIFLTAGTNVHVLDATTPTQPTLITNLNLSITNRFTSVAFRDVAINDGKGYVAGQGVSFAVFDLSQINRPLFLRKQSLTPIVSLNFAGTNLFASGLGGLASFRVNPDNSLTLLQQEFPNASSTGLQVVGSLVYYSDHANGLKIFDVSDPANFQLISTFDTPGSAVAVHVVGHRAFVADSDAGVAVIDVSNSAQPFLVATLATPNLALDVQVRGDRLYVANGAEGVTTWNMISVAGQHLIFPEIADASNIDDPFPLTVTASSGLPVQISLNGPATYANGFITPTGGQGTVRITATQPGNNDFAIATDERTFVIRNLPAAVAAFVQSKNPALPAELITPEADPDADGIPNLVEFLFKSDPNGGDSLAGHTTASILEFFGDYYLLVRFPKPRTTSYPLAIEVGEFNEPAPKTWIQYPVAFNPDGFADFLWPISHDASFPLIRLTLKYP